jgi:hypothetical protein
MNGFR